MKMTRFRLSADRNDTLTNSTRYGRRTPGVYTDPTSYDGTKFRVVGSTYFAGGHPLRSFGGLDQTQRGDKRYRSSACAPVPGSVG